MYSIKEIRTSANFHLVGSIVAVVAGIVSQLVAIPNADVSSIVLGNLLTMAAFGLGFFLLQMGGSSNVLRSVTNSEGTALDNPPPIVKLRLGVNSFSIDIGGMILAIIVMVVLNLLFGANLSVALGGFVGGWLIGVMANQRRAAIKIVDEQMRQQRLFYFTDPGLGPRTQMAYFYVETVRASDFDKSDEPFIPTPKTEMPHLQNAPRKTTSTRPVSNNAKNKAAPLVRNTNVKMAKPESNRVEAKTDNDRKSE